MTKDPRKRYVADEIEKFLEENKELMERLADQEEREKVATKCVTCFFSPCRCSEGLKKRFEQS